MTESKECLERLLKYVNSNEADLITKYGYSALNDIEIIKQDLEVLEWLKEHIDICISDFNWNSLRDFIRILVLEYADGKKVKEWLENE